MKIGPDIKRRGNVVVNKKLLKKTGIPLSTKSGLAAPKSLGKLILLDFRVAGVNDNPELPDANSLTRELQPNLDFIHEIIDMHRQPDSPRVNRKL